MRDLRDRIRHAPHDIETIIQQTESNIQHGADDVEHTAKEIEHKAEHRAKQALGMEEDDEEGWMSDASDGEPRSSTAAEGKRRARRPSKSSSVRPPPPTSRRRSVRRGPFGSRASQRTQSDDMITAHGHSIDDNDYDAEAESPVERRSRSLQHTNSLARIPLSPQSSRPQHARIDSLRSVEMRARGSRELSPARSVRFADQHSGPTTPRAPLSPSSPGTPLPGSEAPSDDESPRNTVRFSLPALNEKKS